ncbi:MAG: hypothetical protein HC906_09735 [Bacteroidales bacterium]|nr:hypothetical protein [Bacteroidales bacterium]
MNNQGILVCHTQGNASYTSFNAYELTEKVQNPVWIIYPDTMELPVSRILMVDVVNEPRIISYALKLSELLRTTLEIALKDTEENDLVNVQNNNEKNNNLFFTVYSYSKTKELMNYAKESNAGLLVMKKEKGSFVRDISGNNRTKNMILKSKTPVLVFH